MLFYFIFIIRCSRRASFATPAVPKIIGHVNPTYLLFETHLCLPVPPFQKALALIYLSCDLDSFTFTTCASVWLIGDASTTNLLHDILDELPSIARSSFTARTSPLQTHLHSLLDALAFTAPAEQRNGRAPISTQEVRT